VKHPAVHFEIIGADPESLRTYYGELFGWEFDSSSPVSGSISEQDNYGFIEHDSASDGVGIPGGVGGGGGHTAHTIFYVGVPEVGAALERAESLGGTRTLGPERSPSGLLIAHFTDPEGNLIGLAGPA
jgi:predicted enzyme related to lactoylglutathione lyase